jgi:hypothetical protein
MNEDDLLIVAHTIYINIRKSPLSTIQKHILVSSIANKTYEEMANVKECFYSERTCRDNGSQLWQVYTEALGKKVTKNNFVESLNLLTQIYDINLEGKEENIPISLSEPSFITGTPITNPNKFYGREKEIKRLFDILQGRTLQNAAIIGPKRSGKTSLLHYLSKINTLPKTYLRPNQKSNWLTKPHTYKWIYIDFQDSRMSSQERVLGKILQSMNLTVPDPCDLLQFMDKIDGNITNPTVILMDEVGVALQRCPELNNSFWECLRSLVTSPQTEGNLAFVLSTRESPQLLAMKSGISSPFFNIFGYTAELGPLTKQEGEELINDSPISFADADITWILKESKCWPLFIQILCRIRLLSLQEDSTLNNWKDEGIKQISYYLELNRLP